MIQDPENISGDKLLQEILGSRCISPALTVKLCKKLARLAADPQDIKLLGSAYYYMAEAYYTLADYHSIYVNLIKGLKFQEEAKAYDLIARTYNLLGLISSAQENVTVALENFCSGLDYCRSRRLYYIEGLIYTNIGDLYKKLHAEKAAIKFLTTSIKLYEKSPDTPFCRTNMLISYVSLGFCYLAMNDNEKAADCKEHIMLLDRMTDNDYHKPALYTYLFRFYHQTGDADARDALLPQLMKALECCTAIYEFYECFFDACQLLTELKYGETLITMLHAIERVINNDEYPALMLRLLNYKVLYYKSVRNKKHYENALLQYFQMKEKQLQSLKEITRSSINLRFVLETLKNDQRNMEEMNRLLQNKSEHDPLTGLANYMHLKNRLEASFETAQEQRSSLGVEILDVDYFKQYNDNYGHISGDHVLTAIAGVLKSIESEHVFCGRYGGDEFIVIYTGISDAEILSFAEKIRDSILRLKIPHCGNAVSSYVTISQGIRNSIPEEYNKSWDYLFAADSALYDVKETHKSSIQLVRNYIVLEEASTRKML